MSSTYSDTPSSTGLGIALLLATLGVLGCFISYNQGHRSGIASTRGYVAKAEHKRSVRASYVSGCTDAARTVINQYQLVDATGQIPTLETVYAACEQDADSAGL